MPEVQEQRLQIIKLALCKMFSEKETKEIRNKISAGVYHLDDTIKLKGVLKIAEDTEAIQPMKADPWHLLGIALSKLNNVSITAFVHEALQFQADDIRTKILKEQVDAALSEIKEATLSTRKGQAKFVGDLLHSVD